MPASQFGIALLIFDAHLHILHLIPWVRGFRGGVAFYLSFRACGQVYRGTGLIRLALLEK